MPLGKAIWQGRALVRDNRLLANGSLPIYHQILGYHDNLLAMLLFVFVKAPVCLCHLEMLVSKIPLNGIKHNIYFSQLWVGSKSVLTESVPGEDSPLALQMANFLLYLTQTRQKELPSIPSHIKTIIPS